MIGFVLENVLTPDYYGLGTMDLGIDTAGHLKILTGPDRIRHDVLKGILTAKSGAYGTILNSLIGVKQGTGIEAIGAYSVQEFVDAYREAQSATLPDDEKISTVRVLNVARDVADSSRVLLQLSLTMTDGQVLSIEYAFGG